MRIAVISDVHSNMPALEAVLPIVATADIIFCCGDVVGYFAHPNEVCECLRDLHAKCIRGNHDAYVLDELEPLATVREIARVDWTRGELTQRNIVWLRSLPTEIRAEVGSLSITVKHACPWDEETYLYEDSPRIEEIRLNYHEMLFIGHTHRSFIKKVGRGFIVNPGSVGQPRDFRGSASLSLVEEVKAKARVIRATYDTVLYQTHLINTGWDPVVVHSLDQEAQLREKAGT